MPLPLLLLVGCSTVDITFHKYDPDQACLEPVVKAMPVEDGWGEWADSRFWGDCMDDVPYYFADADGACWALLEQCEVPEYGHVVVPWAVDDEAEGWRCEAIEEGAAMCGG